MGAGSFLGLCIWRGSEFVTSRLRGTRSSPRLRVSGGGAGRVGGEQARGGRAAPREEG